MKFSCRGWQIKQTVHSLQARQPLSSSPPKNFRLHWFRETSKPWHCISVSQTDMVPWIDCWHLSLMKLSIKGGPWCSCRHITSAAWYVKSSTAQIAPHLPLYLICKRPTLGVFIPSKRTSKPVKDSWMTVLWNSMRYCPCMLWMKRICPTNSTENTVNLSAFEWLDWSFE